MRPPRRARRSVVAWALIVIVHAYQSTFSRLMPGRCRFYPTCSQYAIEAMQTHGALRGGWLAVKRVGRCHPFHRGGLDPVPPR